MHQIIQQSLSRQDRALELLRDLLEEEYQALLARDTDSVAAQEFSIQELIRQLAVEKTLVIRLLAGARVAEYARTLPGQAGESMLALLLDVDRKEQEASRQASRNAQLSLALLDQSSRTLQALTSQAMPPKTETYGRRGGMRAEAHPQAAIFSGRL